MEARNNDVSGENGREGENSGVQKINLMENVEAASRNIAIPVTQLDFLRHTVSCRQRTRIEQ